MLPLPTPLKLPVPLSVTPPVLLIVPLTQLNGPFTTTGALPPNVPLLKIIRLVTAMVAGVFTVRVPPLMIFVPDRENIAGQSHRARRHQHRARAGDTGSGA